jgi:hypothetical protein
MTLEEELDKYASIVGRTSYMDYRELVRCYTCTWIGHYKECDAGHFIRRGHHAVRWDLRNIRPQCVECNRSKNGQPKIFEEELREEIGDDEVDSLIERSREVRFFDQQAKENLLHNLKTLAKAKVYKV